MATKKQYNDLSKACYEGDPNTIATLLDAGLSPDGSEKCPKYERPLSMALMNKRFKAADALLDAGAKPRYGASSLDDFLEDELYEKYVDLILADSCPEIAGMIEKACVAAIGNGNRTMAEKLLAACPPPGEFSYHHTPLVAAIKREQIDMAFWLIEQGFDHNSNGANEAPPATFAILANEPELLKKLFELGESPERRVNGHQTILMPPPPLYKNLKHVRDYPKNDKFEIFHQGSLLHVAAVAGSTACAKVLLDAGVDPNAVDSEGRTPTMLASLGGEATREVLNLLPELDLSSGTALVDLLTRSLMNDDVAGIQQAIENGADLSVRIESEFSTESTSLTIAACRGSLEVLQSLIEGGADLEQADWPEGERRDSSGLRCLLENAGFDSLTNMPMTSARTPLGWAALCGQTDAMTCLLDAGADTNARDVFDFTVLHLAAMSDKPKTLELALGLGTDLHVEAFDKITPLHAAAVMNSVKAIPILIEAGADTTRYNKQGQTPYMAAKEWGKPGAYRKLETHTPEEFRKKKHKAKKAELPWEWDKKQFDTIRKDVKKQHGPVAKKLAAKTFRKALEKSAREESFLETCEELRKNLKGKELGTWDDVAHIRWLEGIKITDTQLLKLQQEFLEKGVFVVRELRSSEGTCRVFVVPTTDLFELIAAFGTNGVNMELNPDLTLAWLMGLFDRHTFRVLGIRHDGLEFRFDEPIADPSDIVQELMIVCPPEMDETNYQKQLRKKLKSKTPQVFLWWD